MPTKERLGKKTRDIDRIRRGLEELERDEIAPGEMKVNMRDRVKGNKGGDEKGDNNGDNGGYDINELGTESRIKKKGPNNLTNPNSNN